MSELPNGWITTRLRDVVQSITYGHTASASEKPIGPRLLRITDIQDGRVDWKRVPYCACEEAAKYRLDVGDIVVARTGATTGKSYLLRSVPEDAVFASYLIRLKPREVLSSEFLSSFMQSPSYWEQVSAVSKGTAQPGANASILGDLDVPLPPLAEQRRIVAKLDDFLNRSRSAKAALDAIPPLLEKLRQSVLAAAFRGDLTADWRAKNPDVEPASELLKRIRDAAAGGGRMRGRETIALARGDEARPEDLPLTWQVARLADLAPLQAGYAFRSSEFSKNGVRLLRGTNIIPDGTRWEDVAYLPPERLGEFSDYEMGLGDIVLAMDRPIVSAGIKVARLAKTDLPALLLQRVGRFRVREGMSAAFLFHFVRSFAFIQHISGQATGTQLPHVSSSDVGSILVPVPPTKEQELIAQRCESALAVVDALRAKLDEAGVQSTQLDRSILAKAFRGDLVPQDPTDEPAATMLARLRATPPPAPAPKRKPR